jgi:UDP-N-acetylmuramoylalanine--D-glutamate ligase
VREIARVILPYPNPLPVGEGINRSFLRKVATANAMTESAMNKQRVIVGLGVTGLSCARFFAKRGIAFSVADSRESPPGVDALKNEFVDVPLHLGAFSAELFSAADELIVSPGVALEEPAIAAALKNGVNVCGDIDLFVREARAPIVAITGSNGKSTVTTLVGEMAKTAQLNVGVGGNLGTAALDLLGPARDLYVLELSSFQLERAQPLNAEVATVLNVSPDHMDRYPSVLAYHQAKHRIFRGCKQIVVNRSDLLSRPLVNADVTSWSFGLDAPDFNAFGVRESNGERFLAFERDLLLLPIRELKIVGDHNVANALAALALGHAIKLPMAAMLKTLREFPGLAHRCQLIAQSNSIGEKSNIAFYDDSKGTNVGATVAAIEGLCAAGRAGKVVLIAGGVSKGAKFDELKPVLEKCGRGLILIGEAAPEIEAVIKNGLPTFGNNTLPIAHARDMQDAVNKAADYAQSGDSVLLSPACASFDMFDNYAHRGDVFIAAVKNYMETL